MDYLKTQQEKNCEEYNEKINKNLGKFWLSAYLINIESGLNTRIIKLFKRFGRLHNLEHNDIYKCD